MKNASKGRILIIDDEPDVIVYLKTLLEDLNYFTLSANDASTGFNIAQKEHPDLICLDVMMPRKSGITLYKELKEDEKLRDIPIVIISGVESVYSFKEPKFRRLIPDKDIPEPTAFFEKPINVPAFIELLSKIFKPSSG